MVDSLYPIWSLVPSCARGLYQGVVSVIPISNSLRL
jgi:hypothetical protein